MCHRDVPWEKKTPGDISMTYVIFIQMAPNAMEKCKENQIIPPNLNNAMKMTFLSILAKLPPCPLLCK